MLPAGTVQVPGERDHPGRAKVPGLHRIPAVGLAAMQDQDHAPGVAGCFKAAQDRPMGGNARHLPILYTALVGCSVSAAPMPTTVVHARFLPIRWSIHKPYGAARRVQPCGYTADRRRSLPL